MPDIWEFGPARDSKVIRSDGDTFPHRMWKLILNGVEVGEYETHCHERRGPDGKLDISFGITCIAYGPPPGGK